MLFLLYTDPSCDGLTYPDSIGRFRRETDMLESSDNDDDREGYSNLNYPIFAWFC